MSAEDHATGKFTPTGSKKSASHLQADRQFDGLIYLFQRFLDYINIARSEGATCVLGGEPGPGWFIPPTIFTSVTNSMRIAQEEVFGPLLSVIPFDSDDEALALAKDIPYGLAAGLWTQSMSRALHFAKHLQAGTVWINTYRAVSYTSPFGGFKSSGLGRESGRPSIYDYLQIKSTWINTAPDFPNPFVMR